MIDHNHFICHFIFGGHLLNIPTEYPKLIILKRKHENARSFNYITNWLSLCSSLFVFFLFHLFLIIIETNPGSI